MFATGDCADLQPVQFSGIPSDMNFTECHGMVEEATLAASGEVMKRFTIQMRVPSTLPESTDGTFNPSIELLGTNFQIPAFGQARQHTTHVLDQSRQLRSFDLANGKSPSRRARLRARSAVRSVDAGGGEARARRHCGVRHAAAVQCHHRLAVQRARLLVPAVDHAHHAAVNQHLNLMLLINPLSLLLLLLLRLLIFRYYYVNVTFGRCRCRSFVAIILFQTFKTILRKKNRPFACSALR